jgi:hypothetical protein
LTGGPSESLNRLIAEQAQQEAINRLTIQRHLLQGSGYNLFSNSNAIGRAPFSLNQLGASQGITFPSTDVLSMLRADALSSSYGQTIAPQGPLVGGLGHIGLSDARTDANQVPMSREYLQQLSTAQLQRLLGDTNQSADTSSPGQTK